MGGFIIQKLRLLLLRAPAATPPGDCACGGTALLCKSIPGAGAAPPVTPFIRSPSVGLPIKPPIGCGLMIGLLVELQGGADLYGGGDLIGCVLVGGRKGPPGDPGGVRSWLLLLPWGAGEGADPSICGGSALRGLE
eukprot:CAMPEP_0197868866 /NCGR_PEP_ID=MMETSP1438-20131217/45511_1 /TAXON_ID=1461541 /ORGANISM="Pterosperma sp., Strain CCMP1384" /LENGTH=135 /DNA_ID=CAMNT_0043487597 /DNA_START=447 /DNA_END=855 /DNA_ORIENTATION=-